MSREPHVIWHDLECGSYVEDLPLWRELADGLRGPVLDVGAGTGRVALDLARRGAEVVALDADARLLAALAARGGGLALTTVCADARDFTLATRVPLVIVPMQTVQLLGGPPGRARFLACARGVIAPGGVLALAIADPLEGAGDESTEPPRPDISELDGVVYSSRAVAIADEGERCAILRVRETVDAGGAHVEEDDVVRLDRLDAATLEREGAEAGLTALPRREVPGTHEYVGSAVVMLGG